MKLLPENPIGVLYGHAEQFNPLFAKLRQRGLDFVVINPADHLYDPAQTRAPFSLVINDMSSPPYLDASVVGTTQAIEYVKHVEQAAPYGSSQLVNGARVAEVFSSRSRQLGVLASAGLPFPRTRIVSSADQLIQAAGELRFPLLLKANHGRSLLRFETAQALINAYINDRFAPDGPQTALLQEYIPAKGNHIVRAETLNGKFLYAVKIHITGEPMLTWPLEVKTEIVTPPAGIVQAIETIARMSLMDLGSVEYVTDRRTNEVLFYSIRPHTSAFSIDVDGMAFNPFERVVDYVEYRLLKIRERELAL